MSTSEHEKDHESDYWQEIYDTLTEGICIFDLDGILYDVNEAYANMVGYSKNELLKMGWLALTPLEYQEEEQKQISRIKAGHVVRYEKAYLHRDGYRVPIFISYRLLKKRAGWDKDRLVATCVDLTETKAREKALIDEKKKIDELQSFRENLFNLAPVGKAIYDADGHYHEVNPKFCEMTGFSRDELVNPDFNWQTIFREKLDDTLALIKRATETGQPQSGELVINAKNGRIEVLCTLLSLPITDKYGRHLQAVWFQDLTQMKQRENEVHHLLEIAKFKEQEMARVRAALDGVEAKVMIADADGIIVYANAAAQNLFTKYADEIRKRLPNFNPSKIVGSSYNPYHRNPQATHAVVTQLTGPHKTTITFGDRTFSFVAQPVRLDGQRIGTSVEWYDITDELAVQNEVEALVNSLQSGNFTMRLKPKESIVAQRLVDAINTLLDESIVLIQYSQQCLQQLANAEIVHNYEQLSGAAKPIQDSYNQTVDSLQVLIEAASRAGGVIGLSTENLRQNQADLAERSSREAASLEEISATVEELSTAVAQTANNAMESSILAEDVHTHTASAQHSAESVADIMVKMAQSAEETRDIAQLVQQIAFQTNILSLNAAVEAARAGVDGRSFAVIATEIRRLSSHVTQEAKRVERIIGQLMHSMRDGELGILQVAKEINGIAELTASMAEHAKSIASASKEQDSGLVELAKAVSTMEEALSQNAAMSEGMLETTDAMADHVNALMAELAHFHLDSVTNDQSTKHPMQTLKPMDLLTSTQAKSGNQTNHAAFSKAVLDAIHAHLQWQHTFADAMQSGQIDPKKAGDAEHCHFGRWLKENLYIQAHPDYRHIVALHQAFHQETYRIATLIQQGKKWEVKAAINGSSRFRALSEQLADALNRLLNPTSNQGWDGF